MRVAAIIGLVLNIVGTSLAGWALRQDYRKHAGKPLLPWAAAAKKWFLVKVLRQTRNVTVQGGMARVTVSASATVTGLVTPAVDAPMDRQIAYLREQVMALHNRIGEHRQEVSAEIGKVRLAVTDARKDAHEAVARVEEMARDIATGTVKVQIVGLLLIGIGSIVAALPVVFGWE